MEEIRLHDTALYRNVRYALKQRILDNCDKILDAFMPVVEPLIGQLEKDLEEYKTINVSSTTPVLIDSYLEKFKSLLPISKDLKSACPDYDTAPSLYYHDHMWHVDWTDGEGYSIKEFGGETPEGAIDLACEWFHSKFCNN